MAGQLTIVQDSFLVQGIMCFEGCGKGIESRLNQTFKQEGFSPETQFYFYSEPVDQGLYRFFVSLHHTGDISEDRWIKFSKQLKTNIKFPIIEEKDRLNQTHYPYLNIMIDLLSMGLMMGLVSVFPPSMALTIALASLSILTTTFTARHYLYAFFKHIQYGNLWTMASSVSLGWLFSVAHVAFHAFTMPLMGPVVLVNMLMPVILMTCINGMDEVKRFIHHYAQQFRLDGMSKLLPGLLDEYVLNTGEKISRGFLQKGMSLRIQQNEVIPVDCSLQSDSAYLDMMSITGETHTLKKKGEMILSGAVNQGEPLEVCVTQDAYHSHINQLLFMSNRKKSYATPFPKFIYFYMGLMAFGLVLTVMAPIVLGHFSIALMIEQIMSTLFSICPCTILMAHELSQILMTYRLTQKEIYLADANLLQRKMPNTVVFDKTGTLTTDSPVADLTNCDASIREQVCLLEKVACARSFHPIAKAIAEASTGSDQKVHDLQIASNGVSGSIDHKKIHMGNAAYISTVLQKTPPEPDRVGESAVFVYEGDEYKGVIYIRHVLKPGMEHFLKGLKAKELIMLTGDVQTVADQLNQDLKKPFKTVLGGQTPQDKKDFLETQTEAVMFGDGTNDAPAFAAAREKGGISISVGGGPSRFFSDISVKNRLDYLHHHDTLCDLVAQNTFQNQVILTLGALIFFGVSFPFSPMIIMLMTTALVLLNAYRVQYEVDTVLERPCAYPLHP